MVDISNLTEYELLELRDRINSRLNVLRNQKRQYVNTKTKSPHRVRHYIFKTQEEANDFINEYGKYAVARQSDVTRRTKPISTRVWGKDTCVDMCLTVETHNQIKTVYKLIPVTGKVFRTIKGEKKLVTARYGDTYYCERSQ